MAFIFAKARLKAHGQNVRRPRVVCTSESQYARVGPTRNLRAPIDHDEATIALVFAKARLKAHGGGFFARADNRPAQRARGPEDSFSHPVLKRRGKLRWRLSSTVGGPPPLPLSARSCTRRR